MMNTGLEMKREMLELGAVLPCLLGLYYSSNMTDPSYRCWNPNNRELKRESKEFRNVQNMRQPILDEVKIS